MFSSKISKRKKGYPTKNKKTHLDLFLFGTLVLLIYCIDRFSKLLSYQLKGCFIFCIKHSINYGAALGLFQSLPIIRSILIAIALLILLMILFVYFNDKIYKKNTLIKNGLIFLFAGTLGNLIDRMFYGYVVDWLTFSFWKDFPAFNIADLSNTVGVILILFAILKDTNRKIYKTKNN